MRKPSAVALVLAGGAARGAYEVGVIKYILEDVSRALGRDVPLPILCGTSVGAINACALAAHADHPRARARLLERHWTEMRMDHMLSLDTGEVLGMVRGLLGFSPSPVKGARRGGLFDPAPIERILGAAVPFERIDEHMARGRLAGLSVSTTHVATGHTVVFVQRPGGDLPPWRRDPTVVPRAAHIRAEHALASAAIPFFFPAVCIEGEYYCDGGLRQNVPLSPARRLGADRLIVINPRHVTPDPPRALEEAREQSFPDPLFLVGKTLNALLLDRIDADIDRLERINQILDAGTRRYGPEFVREINAGMGRDPVAAVRPLRAVHIRSSRDIGVLSGEYARSAQFRGRVGGVLGRVVRRLAAGEGGEADLLSYLLFDGPFARELIALGHADARARHDELCAIFEGAL